MDNPLATEAGTASTNEPSYRFRRHLFERERTVSLTDQGLHWSDGSREGGIPFSGIREIRTYSLPGSQYQPASWRCFVYPAAGRKIGLTSLHFAGLGDFEDRHPAMLDFSRELLARAAEQNPSITFTKGLPRAAWFLGLFFVAAAAGCVLFAGVVLALLLWEARLSAVAAIFFAVSLLGGVAVVLVLWRWLGRSWPQPLDPRKDDPFPS